MKKFLALILALAMILTMGSGNIVWADTPGETIDEITPGESLSTATAMDLGKWYKTKEQLTQGYDCYKFTLTKSGFANFDFQRLSGNIDYTISFNATEIKDGVLTNKIVVASYSRSTTDSNVIKGYNLGLAAGIYYVVVHQKINTQTVVPNDVEVKSNYKLKINFQENANCELEENGDKTKATTIENNKTYEAYSHTLLDQDWYRYTTTAAGYITVNMQHDTIAGKESNQVYVISIYSADATDAALYSKSFKGGETNVTTAPIGVPAGKNYYVVVSNANATETLGAGYKLKLTETAANDWEQERNESAATANDLSANKALTGVLARSGDVDFYKFVSPGTGHFNVELSHDREITGYENSNTFKFAVYDDFNCENCVYLESDIKGYQTDVMSAELSVKKGATYYIKVSGNTNVTEVPYKIKVNFEASDAWEQEKNDEYSTANPIKSGKYYYGSTSTETDVDYYTISLTKKGYLTFDMTHNANTKGKVYKLKIEDKTYATVYETYIDGLSGKYSMAKLGLNKGKYYISISCGAKSYLNKKTYKFKVNAVTDSSWETENNNDFSVANKIKVGTTVHGTTLGNINNSATSDPYDYYKFVMDKDGYVNISMTHDKINGSDSMWYVCIYDSKAKAVKGTGLYVKEALKYSESGVFLLKKGSYYIRVGAQTAGVDKEYGLTVNKISAKKPTIKALTSVKHKAKLSWKIIPGATKYTIYRSSSKNGKYKAVKTISDVSVASWTDSSVKKNKTYYYKMTVTVKAKSSKTSGFSAVKSLKIR